MSATETIAPATPRRHRWRRTKWVVAALAVTGLIATGAFAAWVVSLGPLPLHEARQVSQTVVDRHGKLLLAYEDKRFYSHGGVDPLALSRAAIQLITRGHIVSGGSTITMQLARLIEPRHQRSVYAK